MRLHAAGKVAWRLGLLTTLSSLVVATGCAAGPAAPSTPVVNRSGPPSPPSVAATSAHCGAGEVVSQADYKAVVGWLERVRDGFFSTGDIACLDAYYTSPPPTGYAYDVSSRTQNPSGHVASTGHGRDVAAGATITRVDVAGGEFEASFEPGVEQLVRPTYRWDPALRHWRVASVWAASQ